MMNRMALGIVLSSALVTGCASPRYLVVKSEPAEAEVCIKGKAKSEYFSSTNKSCIGQTPIEIDKAEVFDKSGNRRTVSFKDVDGEENFYLVVGRPGYASQSVEVPAWEHHLALKPEANLTLNPQQPPQNPEKDKEKDNGSIKITSNPVGAMVYVNDILKGNTPYTIEAPANTSVRIKIEHNGFATIERTLSVDAGKSEDVNFRLTAEKDKEPAARTIASEKPAEKIADNPAKQ